MAKQFKKSAWMFSVCVGMASVPAAHANDADELKALSAQLNQLKQSYVNEVRRLRDVEAQLLAVQARLKQAGVEPEGGQSTNSTQTAQAAAPQQGAASTTEVAHTQADKDRATKRSVDDFLQEQHVAFDRKLVVELGASYSHYDRNQLTLNGFLALDAIFLGNISVDRVTSDTLTYTLAARYSLTPNWNVGVSLPFLQRQVTYQKGGAGGSAGAYGELTQNGSVDVGDTTLNLSYRLLPETETRPDVVLTGSVIAPTGQAPFGISWTNQTVQVPSSDPAQAPSTLTIAVPDKLATGNGLWGYGLSMTAVKTLDPALVFANFGYTGYIPRHFDNLATDPNVQNPGDVSLGSSFTYGLGLAFALNDKTSISMSFSDQLTRSARVRYDGGNWTTLVGSSANAGTFNLGMTYALSPKTTLVTTIGVGVTPDAPDFTLGVKVPFML